MNGHIYLIRNRINGKGYVGQTTVGVSRRFAKHLENARRGIDGALYRAIRKHGAENFTVIEIAACTRILLDDLEKHYIEFFGTFSARGHGYNMTEGGDSRRVPEGWQQSESSKAKNSASHRGMKRPPRSAEFLAKQSAAQKGKVPSAETRAKLSTALKGVRRGPMTDEHKAKLSAAKKGQGAGKSWAPARRAAQLAKGQ